MPNDEHNSYMNDPVSRAHEKRRQLVADMEQDEKHTAALFAANGPKGAKLSRDYDAAIWRRIGNNDLLRRLDEEIVSYMVNLK